MQVPVDPERWDLFEVTVPGADQVEVEGSWGREEGGDGRESRYWIFHCSKY